MTGAVRTQLVESLRETLGEPIRSVEVVSSGIGGTRRVSKAVGASGKAYAVKEVFNREPVTLGGKDALETEWAALTTLAEMNAAAPRPVAVQFEDGFLVTEWFDGVTFDDACQFEPEGALTFVPPALHALGFIERAFESRIAEVQPYAYAQDYDAFLGDDFSSLVDEAQYGYVEFGRRIGGKASSWEADTSDAWDACADAIRSTEPTFGTLDYNARNVLLGESGIAFLDFSTLGWDYPERRVTQYFVSLGAHHEDGNFVSGLTRETLGSARDSLFFSLEALDAHLIVFCGLILARLLEAGTEIPPNATDEQRHAWSHRRARFRRTLEIVAHGGVSDFAAAERIRAPIRQIVEATGGSPTRGHQR